MMPPSCIGKLMGVKQSLDAGPMARAVASICARSTSPAAVSRPALRATREQLSNSKLIMSERIWMPSGSCNLGQGRLRMERLEDRVEGFKVCQSFVQLSDLDSLCGVSQKKDLEDTDTCSPWTHPAMVLERVD